MNRVALHPHLDRLRSVSAAEVPGTLFAPQPAKEKKNMKTFILTIFVGSIVSGVSFGTTRMNCQFQYRNASLYGSSDFKTVWTNSGPKKNLYVKSLSQIYFRLVGATGQVHYYGCETDGIESTAYGTRNFSCGGRHLVDGMWTGYPGGSYYSSGTTQVNSGSQFADNAEAQVICNLIP